MKVYLAALSLLAVTVSYCSGGEDFSRPNYFLGYADSAGRMELWRDVVSVSAGPGLVLPLRVRFTAAPAVGQPVFGRQWECPLLESSLVAKSERELTWRSLGGRTTRLWRKKDGTFAAGDGSVSARRVSPSESIISTGGAEYRYIDGRIKSLSLSSGAKVEWTYQGSRILGISSPAVGSVLTVEYSGGDPFPSAIVANKKRFELKYQKMPIVAVVASAPMVAGFEDSLGEIAYGGRRESFPVRFEAGGDYVMDFSSNSENMPESAEASSFVWTAETGQLKTDGEWAYTVKTVPEKEPVVVRTNKAGQVESYSSDSKTGITEHRLPDGTIVTRSYFVAAGPTQSKIRKVTEVKDGKELASRQWSYDETGRLVRDRAGNFERNWIWSSEGKLLEETEIFGEKVLSSVKFDQAGRPIEKTLRGKTYKYSYEAGKKVVQKLQDGKLVDTRVIDEASGAVAFFKLDEKNGSLQGGLNKAITALSAKDLEQARALAERSLQTLQNEKSK